MSAVSTPPASPEHYPGTSAAYNSPRIKLLQLRATLSDEDNVIANEVHEEEFFMSRSLYQRDMAGDTSNLAYCKIPQSSR